MSPLFLFCSKDTIDNYIQEGRDGIVIDMPDKGIQEKHIIEKDILEKDVQEKEKTKVYKSKI
jgi:hypothetical protein